MQNKNALVFRGSTFCNTGASQYYNFWSPNYWY